MYWDDTAYSTNGTRGWHSGYQSVTFLDDIEVDDTFGTWFIDSTNYNDVNSTGITLTWDGDTTGITSFTDSSTSLVFYKITDRYFTADELEGFSIYAAVVGDLDAMKYDYTAQSTVESAIVNDNLSLSGIVYTDFEGISTPLVFSISNDFTDDLSNTIEKGTYFMLATADSIHVSTLILPNASEEVLIKKFTRLYDGLVVHSSSGKCWRKLRKTPYATLDGTIIPLEEGVTWFIYLLSSYNTLGCVARYIRVNGKGYYAVVREIVDSNSGEYIVVVDADGNIATVGDTIVMGQDYTTMTVMDESAGITSIVGTWLIDETNIGSMNWEGFWMASVPFESNGETYDTFHVYRGDSTDTFANINYGMIMTRVYTATSKTSGTWLNPNYRTVTFSEDISSDYPLNWLKINATKLS